MQEMTDFESLWNNFESRIFYVKAYIMFHYFFQLSNIVFNSHVSIPSELIMIFSIYFAIFKCKDSRNTSVIWLISQEIKKCSSRADSFFPTPFIPPWIFMLLFSCSNVWLTPVERSDTKLLLNHKFQAKKKSQVSGSLFCRSFIYNK